MFHLRLNALGEDIIVSTYCHMCFSPTMLSLERPFLTRVFYSRLGGESKLSPCTFPFRFRMQCNNDPVLIEETGPKMPDRALLLMYSSLLGRTSRKHSRKKEPGNFLLEVQFGGDVQ